MAKSRTKTDAAGIIVAPAYNPKPTYVYTRHLRILEGRTRTRAHNFRYTVFEALHASLIKGRRRRYWPIGRTFYLLVRTDDYKKWGNNLNPSRKKAIVTKCFFFDGRPFNNWEVINPRSIILLLSIVP